MYEQGAIQHNMFSVYYNSKGGSKIQFGGYNLQKYATGQIDWFPID